MISQKNKLLSVISLLALVMIPVFIAVFFLAQQSFIRYEMKEKLEQATNVKEGEENMEVENNDEEEITVEEEIIANEAAIEDDTENVLAATGAEEIIEDVNDGNPADEKNES